MKALTVQQPWAWAIVHGGKTVENRTTLWKHRGDLAIHAGTRWSDRGGHSPLVHAAAAAAGVPRDDDGSGFVPAIRAGHLPIGAIIGVVNVDDVHVAMPELRGPLGYPLDSACCESPWAEQEYVEAGTLRKRTSLVHLVLDNVRPLPEPIPCRGALGLWTVPHDTEEEIRACL